VTRPKCDGGPRGDCATWPTWKIREKSDTSDRNWFYACGRHLHFAADEMTGGEQGGPGIDLVRIRTDEH
jgi:hypothetical protein